MNHLLIGLAAILMLNATVLTIPGEEQLTTRTNENTEALDLRYTDATAHQVREIGTRYPNLKKLNLSKHYDNKDSLFDFRCDYDSVAAGFIDLPKGSFSQLEELVLDETNATADQIRAIGAHCPNLRNLSLLGCNGAAEGFIGLSAGEFSQLEVLDLRYTNATAHQVQAIGAHCPNLKHLFLAYCPGSAAGFIDLAKGNFSQLKVLDLSSTRATAHQMRAIGAHCPNLRSLSLRDCCDALACFTGQPASISLRNSFCCRRTAAEFTKLPAGSFSQLETLILYETARTYEQWSQILQIQAQLPGCRVYC